MSEEPIERGVGSALVLGGSGYVGAEVVRRLAAAGLRVRFTYLTSEARALALAEEAGAEADRVDLADPEALAAYLEGLAAGPPIGRLIGCAGVAEVGPIEELGWASWERAQRVHAGAPYLAARALAPGMRALGRGDIVLVGALDRAQSAPLPAAFAASQSALLGLVMALAKELGPDGIRANLVALGPLEGGLSRALPEELLSAFLKLSALRRLGTAAEAAEAIAWLALESRYMNGKVLPVNGGL